LAHEIAPTLKTSILTSLLLIGAGLLAGHSAAQIPSAAPSQDTYSTETTATLDSSNPAAIDLTTKAAAASEPALDTVQIAILIDDLGYNLRQGIAAARLPGALTLAVLPHSPNGVAIAELGHQRGKLIMLHAPMSNVKKLPLDAGGLTETMSQQEFVDILYQNLEAIPHVQGLNNHMGSYLTQLDTPMTWLMETLARENLFFIDSRTSPQSIAWETAQSFQVPTRKRDVFLDNKRDQAAIGEQFDQLLRIAKRRGNAIAIGHPYPETIAFLAGVIPSLHELGVELVPVTQLINPAQTRDQTPLLSEH
jgi:uncharacterized protein